MSQYPPQTQFGQAPNMIPHTGHTPLPSGWEMRIDPSTGWAFFIDHKTQTTSWTDPRKAPVNNDYKQYGVREIPIMHEGGQGMPRQQPPQAQAPRTQYQSTRQIPIQREEGRSSPGLRKDPADKEGTWGWQQHAPQSSSPAGRTQYPPAGVPASNNGMANHQTRPTSHTTQKPSAGTDKPTGRNSPKVAQDHHGNVPRPTSKTEYTAPPRVNKPSETVASGGATLAPHGRDQNQQRSVSPAPSNMSTLEHIKLISDEAEDIQARVDRFSGVKTDKEYIYIEEMLTRKLLKLDNIDSEGNSEIRDARRRAVKLVQGQLDQLELKDFANSESPPVVPAGGSESETIKIPPSKQETRAGKEGKTQTSAGVKGDGTSGESANNRNFSNVKDMVLDSEVSC